MTWQKQTQDSPLFPDLLWSRPENKKYAGRLLIIGGKASEFQNISSAYSFAHEAGAGSIKILTPESLRKITENIQGAEFAPSNKSGGFAKTALAQFFDLGEWADHILLAGDFGKNSETTVILDGFLLKNSKPVTISQNALGSIGITFEQLIKMPLTLVIDRMVFQKIGKAVGTHVPITSLTTYENMGDIIQNISARSNASFVIMDEEHIWTAVKGELISTKSKPVDINALSSYCTVWQMQNPGKPLEALSTAVQQSIV
ncbi:MAG TPA: hypothetical protein VFX79_01060 [Candidatus Saccharimonadales bacterium]|nr:hypothetical protein [Candidatus Saccharimonadales bacterium]